MPATRALILLRLSRMTDATTSPERQRQDCERYAEQNGMVIAGVAEDWDVSGSTDPLARTGSGPWLKDRLSEFDVVVAQKLDRVGRNAQHISALMGYLIDAGKNLRCALDSTNITDPIGRMIVYVMATVAELELNAISERNTNAAQYNIRAGKYRGGLVPAGYRAARDEAGDWRIVPDEGGVAPVIREIVGRVIGGERLASIVADLNGRKVQTHKDRQADLMGRPTEGRAWTISNVTRMLVSPTVIGQVVHRPIIADADGKPVKRGNQKQYGEEQVMFENGAPIVRAEPLVPPADFYAVKRIIEDRREAEPKQRRRAETSLLTRVLFCGTCDSPMWRLKGGPGRQPRYRCGSVASGKACGNRSVTVSEADGKALDALFGVMGNLPHIERVFTPGVDNAGAIAEIDAQLLSLSSAIDRFPAGTPAWESVMAKVDGLTATREAKAAEGDTEAGYRYVETGATFGQYWQNLSSAGQNDYLRDHAMRVTFRFTGDGEPVWSIDPGDVPRMVESVNPGAFESARAKLAAVGLPTDDMALVLSTLDRVPDAESLRTESGKPRHAGWAS